MRRLPRSYSLPLLSLFLFIIPVSPNYNLRELDVVSGAGEVSKSANYSYEGVIGQPGSPMNGTTYNGGIGFGFTQMANVPTAPTVTNPASYYDKLHVVINQANNPSDTKYALAISSDGFVTTNYIKADTTVSSSLSLSDYQTYAAWGSGSGFDVIGLLPSTTYAIKVKAFQGDYTESGFGPSASAATVSAQLTFDIDVSPSNTETASPYTTNLGTLLAGSVFTGPDKIWIDLDTNANTGGGIYVRGVNAGLNSARTSTLLAAVTGDLAALASGFGLQGASATQSSGGPMTIDSPFNGAANNVGIENTSYQRIFTTAGPVVGGRASLNLQARVSATTPSSSDYTETLTMTVAASY